MDYRVLGPLEVMSGDREIHIPGLKERALLGLLIVEAGTVVSSDRMIYELWRDRAPSDAASALRTHLSRLRKALGGHNQVATQRPGYVLNIDLSDVDINRFERLADRAVKTRQPEESAEQARLALGEWRGRALTDLEGFEFAETEARRLEERRRTTLATAIDAELSLGRHEQVVSELNALTVQHPYNEVFWSRLMLALYRSGRAGEALETYRRATTILGEGLGIGPSADLRNLERAIVLGDSSLHSPTPTANNLPFAVSSFVGRDRELVALTETMQRARLVTLTGVGGSGKSRLAIEAAHRLLAAFPDGVWKIELAPVRDTSTLAQIVATALGDPVSHATDPTQSLVDHIGRHRILLVLDNCEHLLPAAADLTRRLTESCPHLSVLATSREPLHIPGETVWLVNPLDLPDPGSPAHEQEAAEAFRLFVSRAFSADPTFVVTDDNRRDIALVCHAVAGLPLAIELAAARSPVFTPNQLLQRLRQGLDVLQTDGGRRPHDRNRTMRGSLQWSYRLLDPAQARLFTRLAVFRGGWAIEDLTAMFIEPGQDPATLITALVDKSLVVRDARTPTRYQLLEPVREFAADIFEDSEEAEDIRSRHAGRFLEVAVEAKGHLRGPEQQRWLHRLEAEHANLRSAISWAIGAGDASTTLELVSACGWFWFMNGHWQESWDWLSRALEATGEEEPALRAKAIYTTGALQLIRVNIKPALPLLEEALEICRTVGDRYGEAWCLHLLGHAWSYGAEHDPELMWQAREMFVELGCSWEVAWSDRYIGDAMGLKGDAEAGIELQLRSISAFREMGDRWSTAFGLHNVANLIEYVDDYGPSAAIPYFERCLRAAEEIGDPVWAAHGVRGLSECAYQLERDDAEDLLLDAIDRLRQIGDETCLSTALGYLGDLQRRQDRPSEAAANIANALRMRHKLGSDTGVAVNLIRLALLALSQGRDDDATRLATAADPIAADWGGRVPAIYRRQHDELMAEVGTLGTTTETEETIGWALEWADMVAFGGTAAV